MNYHYRATYSFKDDAIGADPAGFVVVENTGATVQVIAALGGHAKVLEQYDPGGGYTTVTQTFTAGAQTAGTIEFYVRATDNYNYVFYLRSGTTQGIILYFRWEVGQLKLQSYYAAAFHDLADIAINVWYHVRLYFDCATDTYDIWLDSVALAQSSFNTGLTSADNVQFYWNASGPDYCYLDALDYSWDTDYFTNRNLTLDMEGVYLAETEDTNISFYHYVQGVNELPDSVVLSIADPQMTLYSATYDATYYGKDIKIFSAYDLVWQGRVNAIPLWANGYILLIGEGYSEQWADRLVTALSQYLTAVTNGLTTVQDLEAGQERFTGYITDLDATTLTDTGKAWDVNGWANWMVVVDTLASIPVAQRWLSLDWQQNPITITVQASVDDATYRNDNTTWYRSNNNIKMGCADPVGEAYRAYIRFPLNIPKGVTITAATLDIFNLGGAGDPHFYIYLMNYDNQGSYPTGVVDETGYTSETATYIEWTPAAGWDSVNIITLVQAYIDRAGYHAGQYMGLRIKVTAAEVNHYQECNNFDYASNLEHINIEYTPLANIKFQWAVTSNTAEALTPTSFDEEGIILGNAYLIVPQTTKLAEIMATTWDLAATVTTSAVASVLGIVKRFADGAKAWDVIRDCRTVDGYIYRLKNNLVFTLKLPGDIASSGTLPLDVKKDTGVRFETPPGSVINLIKAKDRYGTEIIRAWNYTTHAAVDTAIVDLPANLIQTEMFLPCPEYADAATLKNMMDALLKSRAEPQLSENISAELTNDPFIESGLVSIEPGLKVSIPWMGATYTDYIVTRKEYNSETRKCLLQLVKYR